MKNTIILIFGGITLFLFGLNSLKSFLLLKVSEKIKTKILLFTKNNLTSFLVGTLSTILIQSSSTITLITIAFLSSNFISLKSSIFIMLGSNIGTCITPFLFTFNINDYSLIIIIIGFLLYSFNKTKNIGNIIISLGLIFLGFYFFNLGVGGISKNENIISFFKLTNSTFLSLLISTFFAFLFQSSSSTIAIVQSLCLNEIITLHKGIVFVLGSNIGTSIASLLYCFKLEKKAKKAVIINILFNILGSFLFLIFLKPYYNFLIIFKKTPELLIANSHLFFNIITSVIFFLLLNFLDKRRKFFLFN